MCFWDFFDIMVDMFNGLALFLLIMLIGDMIEERRQRGWSISDLRPMRIARVLFLLLLLGNCVHLFHNTWVNAHETWTCNHN